MKYDPVLPNRKVHYEALVDFTILLIDLTDRSVADVPHPVRLVGEMRTMVETLVAQVSPLFNAATNTVMSSGLTDLVGAIAHHASRPPILMLIAVYVVRVIRAARRERRRNPILSAWQPWPWERLFGR